MVHAPAGAPTPAWGEDDRHPQVLTDERGRRYALVPLGAGDAITVGHAGVADIAPPAGHGVSPGAPEGRAPVETPDALPDWRLTPRELDVALRVARGFTNKRIALECGMREGTVKSHIHRLFHKLHVASRVELVLQLQQGARRGD